MKWKAFPNLGSLLRGHFFAGLLVFIPIGVITWLFLAAVRMLWGFQRVLPADWHPEAWIEDPNLTRLVSLGFVAGLTLLLALGISAFGWASKQYIGLKALEAVAHLIEQIPILRGVYSALDQLLRTLASGGGKQFSRVVYVEYPRKGCWALAFVTSSAKGPNAPEKHLNLYVPTTPNPTSGFHLIVPETDVRESGMSVEDAFKTILSLGIAQPSS